jgi:stage V sporulation protein D (sporulation-specific penicillin-binding protein)
MAAPTVGAVMADILPYLGVKQSFGPEDAAGQIILLDDYVGLTAEEAMKKLKEKGLSALTVGEGDSVLSQLPEAGQTVPGGSQVLLYLEENPGPERVEVPDFSGMNRQQASDAAGLLGLYILVAGNGEISPQVTVSAQSVAAKTQVPGGTTITLTFTDSTARD